MNSGPSHGLLGALKRRARLVVDQVANKDVAGEKAGGEGYGHVEPDFSPIDDEHRSPNCAECYKGNYGVQQVIPQAFRGEDRPVCPVSMENQVSCDPQEHEDRNSPDLDLDRNVHST